MIRDTSYTNPDTLRTLYRNPANPLKDLDEELSATAQLLAPPPGVVGIPGTGGGGEPGGGLDPPCPAVFEFTCIYDFKLHRPRFVFVQEINAGIDRIWHPILRKFRLVTGAEIVKGVDCVRVETFAGAGQTVSLTHPVIQSIDDDRGLSIASMLQDLEAEHHAVAQLGSRKDLVPTEISQIVSVGKLDVVRIRMEGKQGGIYASGSDPDALLLGHNAKNNGPGGGGGGF